MYVDPPMAPLVSVTALVALKNHVAVQLGAVPPRLG
jgi:hypothetical protein